MKKSIIFATVAAVAFLAFSCQYEPTKKIKTPSLSGIRGKIIIDGVEDLSMCSIIAEKQINGQTASVMNKIGNKNTMSDLNRISADGQMQPGEPGADSTLLGTGSEEYIFTTVSDETGYFELMDLPEGLYTVTAYREYTLGSVSKDVIVTPMAVTEVDIVLTATGSISGTVQLEVGTEGLQGTFVYVEGTSYVAGTDYFGHYIIMNVPTGTYDVIFYHDEYTQAETEGVVVNAASDTQLDMVDLAYIGNNPVISTLDADPFIIEPNNTVTLTASAFDPDGDELTYTWTSAHGTFGSASGNPVTWTTEEEDVTCKITVTVSDGVNETTGSVNVYVVPAGILEGNAWRGDFTVEDIYDLEFISNYERVIGDLLISDTDLTDLDQLQNLTRVDGNLRIFSNDFLTNVSGLSNLTYVGEMLYLSNNDSLTNLDGFSNLSTFKSLTVIFHTSLEDLGGLSGIDSIEGDVKIEGNSALTDIGGLANVTSIGGNFVLKNNDALNVVTGLDSIVTVGGNLEIEDNGSLLNLDGLAGLTGVGGTLNITRNLLLSDVSGLSGVGYVDGDFIVHDNDSLSYLTGLSGLTSIGASLAIQSNEVLLDLDGLGGLNYVGLDVRIESNPSLENIEGLQGISIIYGLVNIFNNVALQDIDGLRNCTSVGGDLTISQDPSISSLNGLGELTYAGGDLELLYLNGITDIDPLGNLTEINGNLWVMYNDSLTDLDGLSSLTGNVKSLCVTNNLVLNSIGGLGEITSVNVDLKIEDNPGLVYLEGLDNITYIGDDLSILRNNLLVNLDALTALDYVGGNLYICYNIELPESLAWDLHDQLTTFLGNAIILGNKQE